LTDKVANLLAEQIEHLQNYEDSYFDDTTKDNLIKKLTEIKSCKGQHYIDFEKERRSITEQNLRVSEIIELLRKAKKTLPDICCFHSPKLRRSLMKNHELINTNIQDLIKDENLKEQKYRLTKSIKTSKPQHKAIHCSINDRNKLKNINNPYKNNQEVNLKILNNHKEYIKDQMLIDEKEDKFKRDINIDDIEKTHKEFNKKNEAKEIEVKNGEERNIEIKEKRGGNKRNNRGDEEIDRGDEEIDRNIGREKNGIVRRNNESVIRERKEDLETAMVIDYTITPKVELLLILEKS